MTVQVNKNHDFPLLLALRNQLLEMIDLRQKLLFACVKLSIEVFAHYPCPVVSKHHSIWVQHRNYLKSYILPQHPSLDLFRGSQLSQQSIQHPRTRSLSTVSPSVNHHKPLLLAIIEHISQSVLYCQKWQVHPTHRLPKFRHHYAQLTPLIDSLTVHLKPSLKKGVSVGYSSRKEHLIVVMLESIAERQHKCTTLRLTLTLSQWRFVPVVNTISAGFPLPSLLSAPHVRPHAPLIQRVHLLEAVDVESHPALALVGCAEVEPLLVTGCVGVDAHVEVILHMPHPALCASYLYRRAQVAPLELAVEGQTALSRRQQRTLGLPERSFLSSVPVDLSQPPQPGVRVP